MDSSSRLYHGTDAELTVFDRSFSRTAAHIYTTPDPKTAAAYGSNVYVVRPKREVRVADLISDYALLAKLADTFWEDFVDDVRDSDEVLALRQALITKMIEGGADEIDADFDVDDLPEYKSAIEKKAKQAFATLIDGGETYNRGYNSTFQDSVMDECFEMGYDVVRLHDPSPMSAGSPESYVWNHADDIEIMRKLDTEEIENSRHDFVGETYFDVISKPLL